MKIDKLHTLSQFVDLINAKIKAEGVDRFAPTNLELIQEYNNFLKQSLIKEMFVNSINEPKAMTLYNMQMFECTADEMRICREYKEAEKKVIFELSDKVRLDEENYHGCVLLKRGCIPFGFLINDLAEATKGTLTLKNVEL